MRRQYLALALLVFLAGLTRAADARAAVLSLQNGWTAAPNGTSPPEVFVDAGLNRGIVYFKGAMASGTSNPAFTLPPEM